MDDDFVHELVQLIEVGNYVETACHAMGIDQSTYYKWLTEGRRVFDLVQGRDDTDELIARMQDGELVLGLSATQCRCFLFLQSITKASARSEAFAVAMVRKHMPDQWTAAMTFLERRFPGRWKRKEQIDIGDQAAAATGIDETLLLQDPEAVKLLHDALDRASKGELSPPVEATVVDDDDAPAQPGAPAAG